MANTTRLSTLNLELVRHGWDKPGKDRSIYGKPLSIAGRVFEHGVGTHAVSDMTIDLAGRGVRFKSWVGVDDDSLPRIGSVNFKIHASSGVLWQSRPMRHGDPALLINLDISELEWITLEVADTETGHQYDLADWAEAVVEMQDGEPKLVPPRYPNDPIRSPLIGRSIDHIAQPHALPFDRVLEGPITDWTMLTAEGAWGVEYVLKPIMLTESGFRYTQRRGRASHGMKAWWLFSNRRTGHGLALALAYMGNWTLSASPCDEGIRIQLSTSPTHLVPFDTFAGLPIPGVLVADFEGHWDYGAQPIVRFARENLLRDLGKDWPWVQYNTWYADADRIDETSLLASVDIAAELGCELFTIDSGWFGNHNPLVGWDEALGDWEVNRTKLPNGLEPIIERVRQGGMKFGLWIEIECAHPSTPIGQAHPDWFLAGPDGKRLSKRDALDFGNPEVVAWAKSIIDDLVTRYRLDYIKMDFNVDLAFDSESLLDCPIYRHYRGLAELWKHMRREYPRLVIENCASGSLRQEISAIAYTDTHWVSDGIEHQNSVPYMMGATYLMPSSICNHWTCYPTEDHPALDIDAQFVVHMMGHFGLSGKSSDFTGHVGDIARGRIEDYKRLRELIRTSDVYHLTNPWENGIQVALYVDSLSGRALVFAFQNGDDRMSIRVPLPGLLKGREYLVIHVGKTKQKTTSSAEEMVEPGLELIFPTHRSAMVLLLEPN